jgi:hypothetical protein
MGSKIHLYALPGLPLHVEDLMPQPLLARCAGSLSAQGHCVLIVDEGTVDRLELASTPALTATLHELQDVTNSPLDGWAGRFSSRERHLRRVLARFRADRIAQTLSPRPHGAPALAVIQIQRAKDVVDARILARQLKASYGGLTVAVAGDFVNRYARLLLLGSPEFDAACLGPAESIVAGLARSLNDRDRWRTVPGLVFRLGSTICEGPGQPLPIDPCFAPADYHPSRYPSLLDGGKIKLFTLPHSTGHAHQAHYRGGYQPRGRAVRESRQMRMDVEQLHRLYGAETFHVSGSHTPAGSIQGFAAECLSLPYPIQYSRDGHVHELDTETLQALSRSGCRALSLTLLTGSQWTLSDFFGENWTISEVEACMRRIRAHGVYLHTEFTYPCPADDYHTRAETFRIIRRNRPDSVHFNLPELIPGSAWFQHAPEFNYLVSLKRFEAWVSSPPFVACHRTNAAGLPFQINGLRGSAVSALHESAMAELAELKIDCVSGAMVALMARVSGFAGRETEYTSLIDQAVLRLDLPRLRETIESFNIRATASINTIDLYPTVSIRKAVGN